MFGGNNQFIQGFYFIPTDQELLREYLLKKFNGEGFCPNVIEEYDVYSTEPWSLPKKLKHSKEGKAYYFSEAKRKNPGSNRLLRLAGDGYWHMNGVTKKIYDQGNHLGNTMTLNYIYGPTKRKTRWIMHEYRINPTFLDKSKSTELVLCSIQESGKGEETSIIRGGNSNHLLEKKELEQPVARVLEPDVLTMKALEPNFKYAPTNTTANITSTWEAEAHAIEMLEDSNQYSNHHHQQQQQQQNDDALVGLPEPNGRLEEFMNPEWLKQMEQQDLFDWTTIPFDGFLDANDDPHLFPPSQAS